METRFTILTSFGIDGNDSGKKAFYIFYKKKLILYRYFEEVKDIRGMLIEVYNLLKDDPEIKIEKRLNYLYFSWLEEESKMGGALWG